MEITGNGEVKGLDSAQGMPMFNGPRQIWAKDASGIEDVTCEGRYMGEINPVRGLNDQESYGSMAPIRDMPTMDGSWKMGEFPK